MRKTRWIGEKKTKKFPRTYFPALHDWVKAHKSDTLKKIIIIKLETATCKYGKELF